MTAPFEPDTAFALLEHKVETLESDFFAQLQAQRRTIGALPDPAGSIVNGKVQFFSIEPSPAKGDELEPAIVVGIGINYAQGQVKRDNGTSFARHLQTVSSDNDQGMRKATDATFTAFEHHRQVWMDNRYASKGLILPSKAQGRWDYVLIATNFSPFLTLKKWLVHEAKTPDVCSALLNCWDHLRHLKSLIDALKPFEPRVIWIGHGKHQWERFAEWQQETRVEPWLLSLNLSGYNTSRILPFWDTPIGNKNDSGPATARHLPRRSRPGLAMGATAEK